MHDFRKLRVSLDQDSWHKLESEGIWARIIRPFADKVLAEVYNIPFFTKRFSLGDMVLARPCNHELLLVQVLEQSGNSTYRIFVDGEQNNVSSRLAELKSAGCDWEVGEFRGGILHALNVPASADIFKIYRLLEKGQSDGVWYFEEGHVGHSLAREQIPRLL